MATAKQPITITPAAIGQIRQLLDKRGKPSLGIRIGVKTRGCSGQAYTLEYADTAQPFEESMDFGDFKVFIDPKALLFVLGTEMDFQQEKLQSGFTFKNPNEKGRCGCGESFHV
jgi:iron-sulfur cluster assembly protein